ncbi:MAG: HAMP domain-containing sensor histidine kinase [Phormidesmis sp.]
MFQQIRTRLVLNNLLVFALVLGGFAIAVRFVFVQNLKQQTTEKLISGGQGIVAEAELDDNGNLKVEDEFLAQTLLDQEQSFEWFDMQGNLVERMGETFPDEPLDTSTINDFDRKGENHIHSVTMPIRGELTREQIGYVRVNEQMDDFEETIFLLDMGLGVGVIVAAVLSSAGIFWLNRQAMQPIEASFARLKQFTADASHELRSPLMAISSNAEVSLKYSEGMRDDDREAMTAMLSASDQMRSLTEDLLLLARTDKVSPVKFALLDLSNSLKNLLQLYYAQAAEKEINLTTDLEAGLTILGDSASLTRAFTNLIQNAIRYTTKGGNIQLQAKYVGHQVQVSLQDSGIGIEKANLEKVFERFWRADKARKYDDAGSGLGLSITRAIVENHGGTIEVSSKFGMGSRFVVTFSARGAECEK